MSTLAPAFPQLMILDPGNFTPIYDLNLAAALADRGWRPSFVTSRHEFDSLAIPQGVTVKNDFFRILNSPVPNRFRRPALLRRVIKLSSYPFDLAALSKTLGNRDPGILHFQWALLPPADLWFWERCHSRGWKLVYTVHEPTPLMGTLPDYLTRSRSRLWATADAVLVHEATAAEVVSQAGIARDRVHVLPPGPPVGPATVRREDARLALNISSDAAVVLFFGYIKKYKGLDMLLRSLPLIRDITRPILCLIAGECMESRHRYRALISELQIREKVRWTDGYVPEALMALYFAACDVVALPYLESASSGLLLSAYAFGRPVVATSVGGNSALVEHGETGLLVPSGDPAAFADGLSMILGSPQMASSMGCRGAETVRFRHSWKDIARLTEEVYLNLCPNR